MPFAYRDDAVTGMDPSWESDFAYWTQIVAMGYGVLVDDVLWEVDLGSDALGMRTASLGNGACKGDVLL